MSATRSPATLATPVLPVDDAVVCREFSIPEALVPSLYGWLQILTFPWAWTVGEDTGAAEIEDVNKWFLLMLDNSIGRDCAMLGEVKLWAGAELPDGWLYCDGTEYPNTDYPELAAMIAEGLQTDATHFRVPDLMTGRFPIGGLFTGTQGGEEAHVLTVAEMPGHFHIDNSTDVTGLFVAPGEVPAVIASAPGATSDTGGGEAHNNMPPYEQIAYIIRAVP